MSEPRDYMRELNNLEADVLSEILDLLKKVGGVSQEEHELSFFSFSNVAEFGVQSISADGIAKLDYLEDRPLRSLTESGEIHTADFICLCDDLRELAEKE